jgi:cytochrome c553
MTNSKLVMVATAVCLWLMETGAVALAQGVEEKVAVCAGCHGPNGHSQVPDNPILAGQHPEYLTSALQAYANGQRDYGIMETLAGRLSERDIEVISAYYAAQPPTQTQASAPGDAVRGEALTAVCTACHASGGRSAIPTNPKLAGQHALYLSRALAAYKRGGRTNPSMSAMAASLNEQDMADIAAFYATQPVQAAE